MRLRLAWVIFLFLTSMEEVNGRRPEVILAELLTKPFVPREFASPKCIRDSKFYLEALDVYTPWALQMYDASAKISSGVITGNIKHLGNFDECLRVKSDRGFAGQACYANVVIDLTTNTPHRDLDLGDLLVNVAIASNVTKWTSGRTVTYQWMWCVPSTCNHSEIQEALEIAFDPLKVEGRVDLEIIVYEKSCYTAESTRTTWNTFHYIYIAVLLVFLVLFIVATLATKCGWMQLNQSTPRADEELVKKKSSVCGRILKAFCLYTNVKNLWSTERRHDSISCVDGIRYLHICWIVYGHTFYIETTSAIINLSDIPHMHHDEKNMLVLNANLGTDVFFLLSGLLFTYNEQKKKDRMDPADIRCNFWNVLKIWVNRYIRLTPSYAMVIGFYATLFPMFGTGPQWNSFVGLNSDWCRENWWTNLLYINNFVNVPEMCMSQSWYLAVDMQLNLVLAPIIQCLMYKLSQFWFYIVTGGFLFLSVLIPFFITFFYHLTGTFLYYKDLKDLGDYYLQIYIAPYARFGTWILGAILGQILKKHKIKPSKWAVIAGWLITTSLCLLSLFYPRNMYFDTHEYSVWEASLYAGLHRLFFSIFVFWIILCCVWDCAGPIKDLLSWCGWILPSRLSYGIYLIHYVYLISHVGAARTPGNLTHINVISTFLATMAFSIIMSAVLSLAFEMPFLYISRLLFSEPRRRISNEVTTTTNKQNGDITESGESPNPAITPIQNQGSSSLNEEAFTHNVNFNDTSIMCDNNNVEQCDLNVSSGSEYIDCLETIDENHENIIENVGKQTEKSHDKIYIIPTT